MPKDKGPEWDSVTVAEPDEAVGESKVKHQLTPAQAHPGPAAAGAGSGLAVEDEEMGQKEGSSKMGGDWSTGDENDAE
eukprot:253820-Pelagomonas_calceolata.AAC.1